MSRCTILLYGFKKKKHFTVVAQQMKCLIRAGYAKISNPTNVYFSISFLHCQFDRVTISVPLNAGKGGCDEQLVL